MQGFVTCSDKDWTSRAEQDVFSFNQKPNAASAQKALCSLGIARCLERKLPVNHRTLQKILNFAQSSTMGNTWICRALPETEEELDEQQQLLWRELMGVRLALDKASAASVKGFVRRKRRLDVAQAELIASRYEN